VEEAEWKRTVEGLKATQDWSKWLISLLTGVITIIGAALKLEPQLFDIYTRVGVVLAVLCFIVCEITASGVILWISGLMQHHSYGVNLSLFGMPKDRTFIEKMISGLIFYQYWSFVIGISLFGACVIWSAMTHK
jgi:hypothetical protein